MIRQNLYGFVLTTASVPGVLLVHQGPANLGSQDSMGTSSSRADSEKIATAKMLYKMYCMKCHDTDGTGKAARPQLPEIPDFTNGGWQDKRSNAQLRVAILEGRGKVMPSFRDRISDQQAADLVSLIRVYIRSKRD